MIPGGGGGGGGGGGASASPYFPQNQQLFHSLDGMYAAAFMGAEPAVFDTHCHALLHNLSLLKDKVQQLHPLVGLAVAHDGHAGPVAVSGAGAIIQEIIAAASSMMYAFQQLCGLGASSVNNAAQEDGIAVDVHHGVGHAKNGTAADVGGCSDQVMDHVVQQWQQHHGGNYNHTIHGRTEEVSSPRAAGTVDTIIELDAAELLAKYTHYCQVCGKGFKRDANLRMHMRAHGDEYKSNAALANPTKASVGEDAPAPDAAAAATGRKYSCPQEGCRWNRKHAKFQPLKSVICVKNHYKRSHCPKMYVCNRCNRKQFSVLSDLRTHEKHCGDHRWICSCGTTFSRKDKLVGHVALFAGHEPAVPLEGLGGKHGKRSSSSSELGKGSSGGNLA